MAIDYSKLGEIFGTEILPVAFALYLGYLWFFKYKKVRNDPEKLKKVMGIVETDKGKNETKTY